MGKMQTEKFWLLKALISIMIPSDHQSRSSTHTQSCHGDIEKQFHFLKYIDIFIVLIYFYTLYEQWIE